MDQFFFGINNESIGPLNEEEIRRRAADGEISPQTLAWRQGQEGWLPVAEIPALMTALSDVFESKITPPPLPGPANQQTPPPPLPPVGKSSRPDDDTLPPGITGLQAIAYRFVLFFWKSRRNRPSRVCDYVREDPKRALPVAAATMAGMIFVLCIAVAPFIDDQDYGTQPGQTPTSQMGPGPNMYQPMIDAQRDMGRMIDEGYRDRSRSFDRQSETYRRGTYDWYGNKD